MRLPVSIVPLVLLVVAPACTIVSVGSHGDPPRVESRGLIEGHAALGIADESHLLHLELFDGQSPGAFAEVVLWKLFRLELGLAGASVTLGPLHLGLGVLAYDPAVPVMVDFGEDEHARDAADVPAEPCPDCPAGS